MTNNNKTKENKMKIDNKTQKTLKLLTEAQSILIRLNGRLEDKDLKFWIKNADQGLSFVLHQVTKEMLREQTI